MTEFLHATPRYLYRINPMNLSEVQVKNNRPRARWRHQGYYRDGTQANIEMCRLIFLEKDLHPAHAGGEARGA